jgi:hypothetical protein
VDYLRPATFEECVSEGLGDLTPCPFVSCKHHLYLDVNEQLGSVKINFPDLEPDELAETCAMRVALRGGITLESVAEVMNLTRQRANQLEQLALAKLRGEARSLAEDLDD